MSTPAERVQRFLDNYEGTEIIASARRQPPGCSCPVPLRLSDLREILATAALVTGKWCSDTITVASVDGTVENTFTVEIDPGESW